MTDEQGEWPGFSDGHFAAENIYSQVEQFKGTLPEMEG